MTALYFETEDGQQLDTVIFDGYEVGDSILEGVRFIAKIANENLEVTIHPKDEDYFSTLNTKYWLEKVTDCIQDEELFLDLKTGENVYLVTDEPTQSVQGMVVGAYGLGEVLQQIKTT